MIFDVSCNAAPEVLNAPEVGTVDYSGQAVYDVGLLLYELGNNGELPFEIEKNHAKKKKKKVCVLHRPQFMWKHIQATSLPTSKNNASLNLTAKSSGVIDLLHIQ